MMETSLTTKTFKAMCVSFSRSHTASFHRGMIRHGKAYYASLQTCANGAYQLQKGQEVSTKAMITLQEKVAQFFLPICGPYLIFFHDILKSPNPNFFFTSDPGHFHMWSKIGYKSDVFQNDLSLTGHVIFHPTFMSLKRHRHPNSVPEVEGHGKIKFLFFQPSSLYHLVIILSAPTAQQLTSLLLCISEL